MSPIDDYRSIVEAELAKSSTYESIAQLINDTAGKEITSRHSVRRAVKRWRSDGGSTKLDGDTLEVSSAPKAVLNSDDDLLKERGFDPEEWEVTNVTINEWDSPTGETLKQLKVNAKRLRPLTLPSAARAEGWIAPKTKPFSLSSNDPQKIVFLSDQHAPHHDVNLHQATLAWLRANQPDQGVILGDLLDFPDISRHRSDPAWSASTQLCLDSGYQLLLDYKKASPDTHWTLIEGNHEARLRNTLIDCVAELHGLRRSTVEGEEGLEVMGVPHLLRLDELGIDYVGSKGTYEHTKLTFGKYLGAVHGHIATKGSGNSARKTLDQYGHSILQGHTHRQSIIHKTVYDIAGEPETLLGAEIGCLCQIKGGLGYSLSSDWQQGFGIADIYPDERFNFRLATYVNGMLMADGERYDSAS